MNKRQRKKISKCRRLRLERDRIHSEQLVAKAEAERFRKRLFVLGLDENLEYLPGLSLPTIEEEVDIDTMQYGNWGALCDDHENLVGKVASRLASKIGQALIEQNIARIIVKPHGQSFGPLDDWTTVAVKLTVVPWEQATARRLVYKAVQL